MNILAEANKIVYERSLEREREYGPFIESMERAAKIATLMTGKIITTSDFYKCMMALKMSREAHAHKEDNLLDVVAYAGSLNRFHNGERDER